MRIALLASTVAPRPHGWMGTTEDWSRGLGIGFIVLALVLLVVAWKILARDGLSSRLKELLFIALAVLPLPIVFFDYSYGIEASKTPAACGSCHVMQPYLSDLSNPDSDTLAAVHFKNRYIQEDHCYTCHTDYGMFGTLTAKREGLGHVVRHTTGSYTLPLKIAHPYPNSRCLHCHGESQKFVKSDGHPPEDLARLISGETPCLECHGPAHRTAAAGQ